MRDEFGPVAAAGRGDGRGDKAEVAAAVVGADEPEAVAVIDGVLVLVVALADEGEAAVGLVGGRTRDSVVMWLADSMTRNLPSRVRPTPRLKRSSSSW